MSGGIWRFSGHQAAVVRRHVTGERVYDLGAGLTCEGSLALLALGAAEVVAIDNDERMLALPSPNEPRLRRVLASFADFDPDEARGIKTALVSFPRNCRDVHLLALVRHATKVLYLGKNTDGTACGDLHLFEHFATRGILDYAPSWSATLIVYGTRSLAAEAGVVPTRALRGEELAARSTEEIMLFAEAEGPIGSLASLAEDEGDAEA